MTQQLELFVSSLPNKPYATDDYHQGMKICYKQKALVKKYVQHNPPAKIHWLVMDCDFQNGLEVARERNLPIPNITVINRKNGHSHLFYGLGVPVTRTNLAKKKPLEYLAAVEYALCKALGADVNYAGLISKNPLHPSWLVYETNNDLFEIGELADYLELPSSLPSHAKVVGIGRNCTLFESGRKWAYKQVLKFRVLGDRQGFNGAVKEALLYMNDFPTPLPSSEVAQIAKSIAKWTWNTYTKQWTDGEFSKIQAYRASRGKGVPRYRSTAENRAEAVLMVSGGISLREVAEHFGVGKSSVERWVKTASVASQ